MGGGGVHYGRAATATGLKGPVASFDVPRRHFRLGEGERVEAFPGRAQPGFFSPLLTL